MRAMGRYHLSCSSFSDLPTLGRPQLMLLQCWELNAQQNCNRSDVAGIYWYRRRGWPRWLPGAAGGDPLILWDVHGVEVSGASAVYWQAVLDFEPHAIIVNLAAELGSCCSSSLVWNHYLIFRIPSMAKGCWISSRWCLAFTAVPFGQWRRRA